MYATTLTTSDTTDLLAGTAQTAEEYVVAYDVSLAVLARVLVVRLGRLSHRPLFRRGSRRFARATWVADTRSLHHGDHRRWQSGVRNALVPLEHPRHLRGATEVGHWNVQ